MIVLLNEQEAQELAEKSRRGDSQAFERLWEGTHRMVDIARYYDPTGSRGREDFLQITKLATWKAVNSFKAGKGSSIKSWIRMTMEQMLYKEIKKIKRETPQTFTDMDAPFPDGNGTMEQIIYERLAAAGSYQPIKDFDDELYQAIIEGVRKRIRVNRSLLRCFDLKLENPTMERKEMSQLLGVSRPALSHYMDRIRTNINIVAQKIVIA